jgi:F420-0:gamma-glutamyl ligase-like protein
MPNEVIPLPTKIVTPQDDLMDVLYIYAAPHLQSGDTIVISESVVAITQGRLIRPENVHLGWLAHLFSRFIDPDGSLSSPFAMQVIINEDGSLRVAAAFCAAALSRVLLGRHGDFYRLAGPQAALIDDITGTMPPFDKYIILGPKEPEKVVSEIKRRFGVEAVIMDANDLGSSRILAATPGVHRQQIAALFSENPAGNAYQQTPFVIVRKKTVGAGSHLV